MSFQLGRGTTSAKPPEVVASVGGFPRPATDSAVATLPSPRLPSHETNEPCLCSKLIKRCLIHTSSRAWLKPGSQIAHLCLPRRFIPSNEHDKRFIFYLAKLNTNPTFILYLVPPRCQHSPIPVAFGTTPPGIRYPHASEPHVFQRSMPGFVETLPRPAPDLRVHPKYLQWEKTASPRLITLPHMSCPIWLRMEIFARWGR